ncbi:MAG: BufA1 family periplasmic bufferin-type metallophore [Candidatus Rokuibacteriota bacterium]
MCPVPTVSRSFAVSAPAQGGPAPMPKYEHEKCYGISKAGKNDCETKNSSCAGTSKRNAQGDAWVYVPKGTCDKIVNSAKQPKA